MCHNVDFVGWPNQHVVLEVIRSEFQRQDLAGDGVFSPLGSVRLPVDQLQGEPLFGPPFLFFRFPRPVAVAETASGVY